MRLITFTIIVSCLHPKEMIHPLINDILNSPNLIFTKSSSEKGKIFGDASPLPLPF